MADKCKYLHNGLCKFTPDGEVSEACIMGPCGNESFDKTEVELDIIVLQQLMGCRGITCEDCETKFGHLCFVADREASLELAIEALRSKSEAEKRFEECEWCYDNFTYSYGDSRRYDEEDGKCLNLQDWKYCPNCGRKLLKKRKEGDS